MKIKKHNEKMELRLNMKKTKVATEDSLALKLIKDILKHWIVSPFQDCLLTIKESVVNNALQTSTP